jgi:hypothetical protein
MENNDYIPVGSDSEAARSIITELQHKKKVELVILILSTVYFMTFGILFGVFTYYTDDACTDSRLFVTSKVIFWLLLVVIIWCLAACFVVSWKATEDILNSFATLNFVLMIPGWVGAGYSTEIAGCLDLYYLIWIYSSIFTFMFFFCFCVSGKLKPPTASTPHFRINDPDITDAEGALVALLMNSYNHGDGKNKTIYWRLNWNHNGYSKYGKIKCGCDGLKQFHKVLATDALIQLDISIDLENEDIIESALTLIQNFHMFRHKVEIILNFTCKDINAVIRMLNCILSLNSSTQAFIIKINIHFRSSLKNADIDTKKDLMNLCIKIHKKTTLKFDFLEEKEPFEFIASNQCC